MILKTIEIFVIGFVVMVGAMSLIWLFERALNKFLKLEMVVLIAFSVVAIPLMAFSIGMSICFSGKSVELGQFMHHFFGK